MTSSFDADSHVSSKEPDGEDHSHALRVSELSSEIARLQEDTMDLQGELKSARVEYQHRLDDIDRQKHSYERQLETTRRELEDWRKECQDTEAMRLCTLYMVTRVVRHGAPLDIQAVQEDCRSGAFGAAAETAAAKNLPATTLAPGETTAAPTTTQSFSIGGHVHLSTPAPPPATEHAAVSDDKQVSDAVAAVDASVSRSLGSRRHWRRAPSHHLLSHMSQSAYGWMHAKLRQLNRLAYGGEQHDEGAYLQTASRRTLRDAHAVVSGGPVGELEAVLERAREEREEAKTKLADYRTAMDKQVEAAEWGATHSEQQAVLAAAALQEVKDKCAEGGKKRFCDMFWALKTMKEYEAFATTECTSRVHFLQHHRDPGHVKPHGQH